MNVKKIAVYSAAAYGAWWVYKKYFATMTSQVNNQAAGTYTGQSGKFDAVTNWAAQVRNYFAIGN